MKNIFNIFVLLCLCGLFVSSCKKDETYADKKEKEKTAINSFLIRNLTISDETGALIKVGKINVISETVFKLRGCKTDTTRNEYVLFSSSGVYMQIVREGVGEVMKSGDRKSVICRFLEYNILGDSIQLRNDVPYWHTNPDILDVVNTSGSFAATFNTAINGGGAMYAAYQSISVPKGWLAPLPYIKLGRQVSDEKIAKVRLIVPHSEGTTSASSMVCPFFYEITYQEMRD